MYAQLLIAASFAIASYQDVRERAVSDLVWIPALLGAGYSIYFSGSLLELEIVRIGLLGGIALAFTLYGAIGQADAIALVLFAADPNPSSPILPLVGAAVLALSHIGYEVATGEARGTKIITIERFLHEQKWIPKAIITEGVKVEVDRDVNVAREEVAVKQRPGATVEVTYGVPTVAYLGAGYVGYLAYLIVFNPSLFVALP